MNDLKQQIIDAIDTDFVVDLMDEFDVPHQGYSSGNEVRFMSACHGGEHYNLVWYEDSKMFHCYSECNKSYNIFDLIMEIKGWDFSETLHFLADRLDIEYYSAPKRTVGFPNVRDPADLIPNFRVHDVDEPNEDGLYDIKPLEHIPAILAENYIRYLDDDFYYPEWEAEGISRAVMKRFEIGYHYGTGSCALDNFSAITIPCRDIDGNLLGIRGRYFPEYDLNWNIVCTPRAKYSPLYLNYRMLKFPTGSALYGIYQNQDAIRKAKKCVVFEGEKSVLKMATHYRNYPCVASYGHSISDTQIKMLYNLGVKEIILAYDYDNTGKDLIFYLAQRNKVLAYGINCTVMYKDYSIYLEDKDAPIDKGLLVYELLLRSRL